MLRKIAVFAGAVASIAALNAKAHADVLLGFSFANVTTAQTTFSASQVDGSLSTSSGNNVLSRGSGLLPASLSAAFSSNTNPNNLGDTSFALAATHNEFLQISFTVGDSKTISLSEIDAVIRRSSSGAAPSHFEWAYSFDNFSSVSEFASDGSPLNLAGQPFNYTGFNGDTAGGANGNLQTVDVTAAALQDIAPGTTVTLRLYLYGSSTTTSTVAIGRAAQNGQTYDLSVVGTSSAAVPEPASLGLLGLGSVGLLARRRRV